MVRRWATALRNRRRLGADCRGAVAIEFGFLVMVLILLTVGLIDFARLVWSISTIENAAAEGVRYAVVRGGVSSQPATVEEIENFVRSQAVGVPGEALNISVTFDTNNMPGSRVIVALDYTHEFLVGGLIGLAPLTINKSSRMVIF